MAKAGVEKHEMKYVIKSYVLCNPYTTASELVEFIDTYFNFLTPLNPKKISGICSDNKQGILRGLKKEVRRNSKGFHVNHYYFPK